MKVYIAHSREFDFKKELYEPLRKSKLNKRFELILPHEKSDLPFKSIDLLKESGNIMVADISKPSTGMGIEMGWAHAYKNKIICIYKNGSKYSGAIKAVTQTFIEYENSTDLIKKLEKALEGQ